MIKVVSLFTGCGGLDYGFNESGYDIVFANDSIQSCCDSYAENIDSNIICDDIYNINNSDIPSADIVIGGPPCQGFSGVGKRDPNDDRSKLVWRFMDIIDNVKPKLFLFENVTGISSSLADDGSKVMSNLVISFDKLGYQTDVFTLNSADFGVPQRRKRVFIIGNKLGKRISAPITTHCAKNDQQVLGDIFKKKKWVSAFDALSDLNIPTDDGIIKYTKDPDNEFLRFVRNDELKTDLHFPTKESIRDSSIIPHIKPGSNYMDIPDSLAPDRIKKLKISGGRTTVFGRLHPDMPSYTVNTWFDRPNVGSNIHYEQNRLITIREGLRLQSFPDDYKIISNSKRKYYMQIGNAVPPLLSLSWAEHLKKYL